MTIRKYTFDAGYETATQAVAGTPSDPGDVVTKGYADANYLAAGLFPGVIMPYAGDTAPTGYLLCDGAAVSRSTYSGLFAVVGERFGEGDGSTTFHLPDFRGRFLRGWDDGATRDPDAAGRTAMNTGGATGDNIGSVQDEETAVNSLSNSSSSLSGGATSSDGSHTHTALAYDFAWEGIDSRGGFTSGRTSSGSTNQTTNASGTHSHSVSGTANAQTISGGTETRPINAYVNYIIKT